MYAGGLSGIGDSVQEAVTYLRAQWARFVGLYRNIIDAQHRAAVAAQAAELAGDQEGADQARQVVRNLAELQKKHDAAVRTMDSVADLVGLSGYRGLGVVFTAAQITIITGLALTVAWFFRAYAAEARKLDMIEAGTLTAEQAAALNASVGAAPGDVLGSVRKLATFAMLAGVAFLGLRAFEAYTSIAPRRRARRNPPLVVFDRNPPTDDGPEVFGEQVYGVWYRHADGGGDWFHEFGPGVEMIANPDGTVSIEHAGGRRVWEEF